MHKLDLTIARLKLLLADVGAKRDALAATRHQYQDQIARLVTFAVHEDAGVDRALAMMMEVDARLQELVRQERYLEAIRAKAQYELESLQLTKLIEETRAQLAILRKASRAVSTSAVVLNHPKLKRTVPVGKVPRVRWADGAQCKPVRAMISNRSSRIRPTSEGIAPSILNDTTPHCSAASRGP